MEVVIADRFRGPVGSGNGGYSAGAIAAAAGGGERVVTLRLPPPLETPLRLDGGNVRLGDELVAEVEPSRVGVDPPGPVTWEEAAAAEQSDLSSPFPECFVCGHARGDDALHIHAGPVPGTDLVAATWTVRADTVGREFVWAALDCPGAYAVMAAAGRGTIVLGRFAARIDRVPGAGERCVVVGHALDSEGRKHHAATALYTDAGELLALAEATWIEPRAAF
jgi:hypothetical protein